MALLIDKIADRTGDKLCPLTDRGRVESGEVEEEELAVVA
jgi:hypothetical protein